jgi:hypothetical protein
MSVLPIPHFPLALRNGKKYLGRAEKRVIVSALCAELSRKGLNSDSLPPLFGQGAGVPIRLRHGDAIRGKLWPSSWMNSGAAASP